MLKYTAPITKSPTAARKQPLYTPKIEQIPLCSIKPCAGNARRHDKKQIEQIAESVRKFDFINPLIIDERNEIVAGHGRYAAAKLVGLETVPVIRVSHLTPAEIRAYLVLDNDGVNAAIDSVLVKGIAQAHVWAEELFSGKTDSLVELVERHKVSEGYLKKLMPLAFLAPDIVTSILAGKQPDGLSKEKIVQKKLPLEWSRQLNEIAHACGSSTTVTN